MSVRRPAPGRAMPPGKVASSRRLQEVLRAGTVVGTPVDASESGLTRALKNASITPTGACVPRTFDPDYCAYDRYYTVGVAVVSAVLGALTETRALQATMNAGINAVREALGRQCHVPEAEWWTMPNPQAKQYEQMDEDEKRDARANFSFLCKSLDGALENSEVDDDPEILNTWRYTFNPPFLKVEETNPLVRVAYRLMDMILSPANGVVSFTGQVIHDDRIKDWPYRRTDRANIAFAAGATTVAWILKYVSRYLNEHALMVASFFRVNAKRLDNGEPALLDIAKFVQMCKSDIADGANPPPVPPAYEEFDPEAEAEKRRLAELRARRDARDPLMEGLDYPETYASASDM